MTMVNLPPKAPKRPQPPVKQIPPPKIAAKKALKRSKTMTKLTTIEEFFEMQQRYTHSRSLRPYNMFKKEIFSILKPRISLIKRRLRRPSITTQNQFSVSGSIHRIQNIVTHTIFNKHNFVLRKGARMII